MATVGFVLIYPNALTEMWRLVPKLPVTRLLKSYAPKGLGMTLYSRFIRVFPEAPKESQQEILFRSFGRVPVGKEVVNQ